jgi:prepilin-type N-terminal cleavage/methylation domain-containing protein/prepilin-type processing-associated H-X9-DG protein
VKSKFTLIEMLVVIAIIGVLITMLMPALANAREKSKGAVCKSQMRQCGIAVNLYVDAWDEWMPAVNGYVKNSQLGWRNSLITYMNMDSSQTGDIPFKCPSANLAFGTDTQNAGTCYNVEFGDSRYSHGNRPFKKLTDMEVPTETAVIGDSIDWATDWAVASRLLKPSSSDDPLPVGSRHSGGINILWGDFRVQWKSQSSLRTGKNNNIDYYYLLEK